MRSRLSVVPAPATDSTDASLVRHNAIYFVGSLLVLAFAASYQFLSGRLLGPREYASVASVFSVFSLLLVPGLIVSMVASRYTASLIAGARLGELRLFIRKLSIFLGITSAIAAAVFLVASPLIAEFLRLPTGTVASLTPAILLILVISLNRGILQGEQRFVSLSLVQLLDALTRAALAATLIILGLGANGAIFAISIGLLVSYGASLWPLRPLVFGGTAPGVEAGHVARFAVPAAAAVAGTTLLVNIDVLLVKHFLNPDQAGVYASVATLGRLVFMVTASITAVMFPRVAALEHLGHQSRRTLQISALAMVGTATAAVLVLALAPSLALLPFGPAFTSAGPYLPLYGVGMGAMALSNLIVSYFLALRDNRFVPVMVIGVIGEVGLISIFHASLWQVVVIVMVVGIAMVLGLALLYLFGTRRQTVAGRA
jgi:O-antigen/teichoic acid export membrane protein